MEERHVAAVSPRDEMHCGPITSMRTLSDHVQTARNDLVKFRIRTAEAHRQTAGS